MATTCEKQTREEPSHVTRAYPLTLVLFFSYLSSHFFFFNLETTIAEQKKKTLTASIHNTQVCEYYSNIINNSQNIETHWIEALKVLVPFKADSM